MCTWNIHMYLILWNTLTSTQEYICNFLSPVGCNSSTNRCLKWDFKCTFRSEFDCLLQLPGTMIYQILCNFQSSTWYLLWVYGLLNFMFQILCECSLFNESLNLELWIMIHILLRNLNMPVYCECDIFYFYNIYICNTPDVHKYPVSKSGVPIPIPVPVPKFPGNFAWNE